VLLLAAGVGEAEVDELDFVFLHHLHHVGTVFAIKNLLADAVSWLWVVRTGRPWATTAGRVLAKHGI
jgi:hypothetical protein